MVQQKQNHLENSSARLNSANRQFSQQNQVNHKTVQPEPGYPVDSSAKLKSPRSHFSQNQTTQ